MNARTFLASFFLSIVISSTAHSAVISRDWKSPGDGLLTYDTVSGREWLDLTETQLFKFPGATLPERHAMVVAETAPGGGFAGFVMAAADDVLALAQSAGIDTTTTHFATNEAASSQLIELLGNPIQGAAPSNRWAAGLLGDDSSHGSLTIIFVPAARETAAAGIEYTNFFGSNNGVWLYRVVIPEPAGLGRMLLGGLLAVLVVRGLSVRSRRRTRREPHPHAMTGKAYGVNFSCIAAVLLVVSSSAADGAVISRDWKTPGDGLLTYDTVSGREWLDLSQTRSTSYALIESQLSAGGQFEGFVIASRNDVISFAQSAGMDTASTDFDRNAEPTQRLMELLGSDRASSTSNAFAVGDIAEISTTDLDRYVAQFTVIRQQSPNNFAGLYFLTRTQSPVLLGDRLNRSIGVMLYRHVPEPSTCLLLGVGSSVLLKLWVKNPID